MTLERGNRGSLVDLSQVVSLLVLEWPDLEPIWRRHTGFGPYLPHHPYTDATKIAEALVDQLTAGSEGPDGKRIFMAIEHALERAVPELHKVLVVGLLEDIQTLSMHVGLPLETYDVWLMPETKRAWEAISDLWNGRIPPEEFERVSLGID